jgi:pimeloyl-ACP methyl ester carboxylesterase
MATHPSQLLFLLALGLVAAAALGLAAALLLRAGRPRSAVVRLAPPDLPGGSARVERGVDDGVPRRRQRLLVGLAVLLLLAVFAGRFVVRAFYPAADEPPRVATATATTIRGASGADLAVAHYGPRDAPTLILTHGWGADRRDWVYAIAAMPQRFHVVVWDLPGLGESSAPRDMDYSMARLAAELDRVVTSVQGQPVVLVGHSIGGILNLEYARRYPQKMGREVQGLVQVNSTFTNPVETKQGADLSRRLQKPLLEPLLHVVSWSSPVARALGWLAYESGLAHLQLATQSFAGAETWEQLDQMARYAYRSSPDVVARGVLGMLDWDGSDVLTKIDVPTLVISGDDDVTTLPWASDHMARTIPTSVRVSVERAAHLGPIEQPARYGRAIGRFAVQAIGGEERPLALRIRADEPIP